MADVMRETDRTWKYRPVLVMILAVICAFLTWASLSEVDQHVRGTGRVVPSGKSKTVQHLEGGIIREILVKEGQRVEVGDVLFMIKNIKVESNLEELNIGRESLEIKQARLIAELNDERDVAFPEDLEKKFPDIVESERQLFKVRRQEFMERIGAIRERENQKILRLEELDSRIRNIKEELDVAKQQQAIKARLVESGAISQSMYLQAKSTVKKFITDLEEQQNEVPIVKAELGEIRSQLQETYQGRNSEVLDELKNVKVEIKTLEERMRAYTDEVERTAIKSPIKGIVNRIHINTIGGILMPGDDLAEIIPVEETLIVEGKITTDDRGKVWPGLPVVAKITAYDYTIYGGLQGELVYVSADSFIDNRDQEFYQIRVALKTDKLSGDKPVFPGMTAEINILAGKISIIDALLRPLRRVKQNALRDF